MLGPTQHMGILGRKPFSLRAQISCLPIIDMAKYDLVPVYLLCTTGAHIPKYRLGNGCNATALLKNFKIHGRTVVDGGRFDAVFTCPPYWNLETYSKLAEGCVPCCATTVRKATFNSKHVSIVERLF